MIFLFLIYVCVCVCVCGRFVVVVVSVDVCCCFPKLRVEGHHKGALPITFVPGDAYRR